MKKVLIFIFIASMLMAGCNENVAGSADTSANVAETAPPESAVPEVNEIVTVKAPQFEHDWQTLFYDELTNLNGLIPMFNIYDLDGDGVPELLFSEDPCHAASVALYTVYQGKLVFLGDYGSWGEFEYDFERNYIHSYYWQMGSGSFHIRSFENGKVDDVVSLHSYDGSFSTLPEEAYEINGEEVSEDVFNKEFEKYTFTAREDFISRKYELTPDTIESVLRQYTAG